MKVELALEKSITSKKILLSIGRHPYHKYFEKAIPITFNVL